MYFPAEICATNFAGMEENPRPTTNGWSKTGAGAAGTLGMQAPREAEVVNSMHREEGETTEGRD